MEFEIFKEALIRICNEYDVKCTVNEKDKTIIVFDGFGREDVICTFDKDGYLNDCSSMQ